MDWPQIAPLAAGAVVTAFMLAYWILARWWRSQEGQNVMLLSGLILILCAVGMVRRAGFGIVADQLASIAWAGVAVAYLWRLGLLLRAQGLNFRRPRDKR